MTARDGETPAGGARAAAAPPAGSSGEDFRKQVKAAQAAWNAAARHRARRPRGRQYKAGMARRPPPPPDGDDAA